ncbi:MAG TPA: tyrosine-type recombinase/integrase [Solirubrobacteraceae bacterium]|jgi:integrase|nr:tyrosine-type recombinase/integrase [Solirubrobacteraceae bacterium]
MPKDTKTRYQGVVARHKAGCAVELGKRCNCSPSYWGKVWDKEAGKARRTKFLPTLSAACNARHDLVRDVRTGTLPASESMRVALAVETFLRAARSGVALNKHGRRYKPSALRDLDGALNNHAVTAFGTKKLGDVRRRHVQQLVDELTPRLSGSSIRSVVNAIRSLYRWAQAREIVYHDPAALVQLPAMDSTPRDRVATPEEMARLLTLLDAKDAVPFALAAYSTARRSEIRHALVEDVDLDLGVIYLGVDEHGRKSRAAMRAVPIVKPLSIILRRRLLERGRPSGEELLCRGHKPGGRNSGLLSFEALQTRADDTWEPKDENGKLLPARKLADRITPHECRHTCSTWLDAAGVRPVVVSRLMGHSTPARQAGAAQITQERYTHVLPGDLELAREQLDAYLAPASEKRASR